MRTVAEIEGVIRQTRAELDEARRAGGMALHIPTDGYQQDGDWLNILVVPDQEGVRAYQYVDALGQLERRLRAAGVQCVLLVPAIED